MGSLDVLRSLAESEDFTDEQWHQVERMVTEWDRSASRYIAGPNGVADLAVLHGLATVALAILSHAAKEMDRKLAEAKELDPEAKRDLELVIEHGKDSTAFEKCIVYGFLAGIGFAVREIRIGDE